MMYRNAVHGGLLVDIQLVDMRGDPKSSMLLALRGEAGRGALCTNKPRRLSMSWI